jgi:hypothetical protein
MTYLKRTVFTVTLAAGLAASSRASAEPFVHRDLTLPRGVWALDLGLGVGHISRDPPFDDLTGIGFNLEAKGGLTSALQLGIRTGIRVGTDGKLTRADQYGRTFETETYGTGVDSVANPEISLRYAVVDSPTADLALQGAVYLPVEEGTKAGIEVAVP